MSAPEPVELLDGVRHLRCDNPGAMTLTGTNTYVVALTPSNADGVDLAVIDPGPESVDEAVSAHQDGLLALVEQLSTTRGVAVLATHHHADHIGGLPPFVQRLRAASFDVEVYGATWEPPPARLSELETLTTPGHTQDSLSFLLPRAGRAVLFSGDTLLGGSSSFIAHPDGNLTDYLHTLDVLDAATVPYADVMLAPGHGNAGGSARDVVAEYREHRLMRLAEVRAALDARPDLGPGDGQARVQTVIKAVYPGLDPALRPALEAIVRAQLAHLDGETGQSR